MATRRSANGANGKLPRIPLPDVHGGDLGRLEACLDGYVRQVAQLSEEFDALRAEHQKLRADVAAVEDAVPRVEDELRRSIEDLQDAVSARESHSSDAATRRKAVRSLRDHVRASVPRDAAVLVAGKASADVLRLPVRAVRPFPQAPDGSYAGYHPACSTSAIAHLETLRSQGADALLIPEASRWWLDHYVDFTRHMDTRYRRLFDDAGAGVMFSLRDTPPSASCWSELEDAFTQFRSMNGRDAAVLDWNTGWDLAARLPNLAVFSPPHSGAVLTYLDRTVDFVAIRAGDTDVLAEAQRVAATAVITVDASDVHIAWTSPASASRLPTASIIIPCFNGVAHTDACLTALIDTLPADFDGEIIVVDDASTDGTAECLARRSQVEKRLKIVRNRSNAGFTRCANQGANAASGDVLVFLNNDTIPIAGWLSPLLRLLSDHPEIGAAGGRLVYPDGRLQESGSVVFSDGSAANFGRDDLNPDLPLYRFVRDVDYCSAALMATRRSVFEEAGGFEAEYEPGYYEDTDYCFKLRDRGYRVVVQPESVVVHVEGGTAGLDVSTGMKRHQVINRETFQRRWRHVLDRQPARPDRFDFETLHALAIHGASGGAIFNGR